MPTKRPNDIDDNLDELDLESKDVFSGAIDDSFLNKNKNGILVFNEKKYAVGLIWLIGQEFQDDGSVYKKAQSIACDFYCTRSFIDQNGFSTIKLKHRMGMASAAAMAADALVGEWHGVFVADNGWLYVAVHSDTIAPEGDLFFLSEEDAYNHFVVEATRYKWPKTYVPESWSVKDNDGQIDLEKVLDDIATTTLKPANLNAFFGSSANKTVAIFTLLIICVFLLILMFSQSLISNIIPQKATVPSPQLNISEALAIPPKEPIYTKDPIKTLLENTTLPSSALMVNSCVENFDQLMVSIPGWNISHMRCRGNLVEAIWQVGVGSLQTLQENIDQFPFGTSRTYGANGDFLATKIMQGTSAFNRPLILSSREDALIAINNRFNSIGSLSVRDIAAKEDSANDQRRRQGRSNTPQESASKPLTLEGIPSLGISITTDVSPIEIKNIFSFPGLKFNVVEWDIKNGQWFYDMQLYLYPEDHQVR